MLTRKDITNPRGQAFAPGDLVQLTKNSAGYPVDTLFRVLGSITQCHATIQAPETWPELTSEHQNPLPESYCLVHVGSGYLSYWHEEEELSLVPEHMEVLPGH